MGLGNGKHCCDRQCFQEAKLAQESLQKCKGLYWSALVKDRIVFHSVSGHHVHLLLHILLHTSVFFFFINQAFSQFDCLNHDCKALDVMPYLAMFQLKSNPSDKEKMDAQSQLTKSDEIQRLVAQARSSFNSKDYVTAASQFDAVIEARQHFLALIFTRKYDVCFFYVLITAECREQLYSY